MVKVSKLGPGTPGGKQIAWDFAHWRTTGFNPLDAPGSADHYRSRAMYQEAVGTVSAFRRQAQKIASMVIEQMPEGELTELRSLVPPTKDQNLVRDSIYKNPWVREVQGKEEDFDKGEDEDDEDGDEDEEMEEERDCDSTNHGGKEYDACKETEEEDDDDEDFDPVKENVDVPEDIDDDELDKFFERISTAELKSSRAPYILRHPNNKKVGVVFILDGDVADAEANMFEVSEDGRSVKQYSRVPKERLNAADLMCVGEKENEAFGFQDAHLMVLQAMIDERMEGLPRDENGYIWEARDKVKLPFQCKPRYYNKEGQRIANYLFRRNKAGFSWAYFWLLAYEQERPASRRITGQKVTTLDQCSMFTEKSVYSNSSYM